MDQSNGKAEHGDKKPTENGNNKQDTTSQKKPGGGYDSTPIQHRPPGYTVKITFHGATHLPIADLSDLSSDPYIHATLTTDLPSRHKEDPPLKFRSRTLWRTCDPEWNEQWTIAHIPASGFKLKVRVYDEDSSDTDDRLGNVHVNVGRVDENWEGIHKQSFKIKKRSGSWRAYALRGIAVGLGKAEEMSGRLNISVECLGRSEGNEGGRCYTLGLNYWCKHYSPLLGRIVNQREPTQQDAQGVEHGPNHAQSNGNANGNHKHIPGTSRTGHYNFQANQMQLQGPVPPELYHRYVDFRPIVAAIFTSKGIRGLLLHKAFHHQHTQVYNFNRNTEYGSFDGPSKQMTSQFLDLVHYDEGGRMFTYIITLDGLLRFTETGKEFGIDLLSKHTMHSDASIYIAFSGEFFIRRLRHPHQDPSEQANTGSHVDGDHNRDAENVAANEEQSRPTNNGKARASSSSVSRDPSHYELIVDNSSGTYRPNAECFPYLRDFLQRNFPGLKIVTVDGTKDEELLKKLKDQQRERKKREGAQVVFTQQSSRSSISSSDEERLDHLQKRIGEAGEADEKKHQLGEAIAPYLGNHSHLRSGLTKHEHEHEHSHGHHHGHENGIEANAGTGAAATSSSSNNPTQA